MAVITEQFATFENGAVVMYMIYDNRNTTDDTRWRLQQIQAQNGGTIRYEVWVEDPATGVRFPAAGLESVVDVGTTRTWDVPAQYRNASPYEYNWRCRGYV